MLFILFVAPILSGRKAIFGLDSRCHCFILASKYLHLFFFSRDERRWMEKENRHMRQKRKKDEIARIRTLVGRLHINFNFFQDFIFENLPIKYKYILIHGLNGKGVCSTMCLHNDRIDHCAKDGRQGVSVLHVVFTMILCGTNFFIW